MPAILRAASAGALLLLGALTAAAADPQTDEAAIVAALPLIERPASGAGEHLVVMLSGDGGWERLVETVSKQLNARGMPVVGWSTLRYFWAAKTPDDAARDLAVVISHYLRVWHRSRAIVVGYSRGAEVLPVMVRRMQERSREGVYALVLFAPERIAGFEFHMVEWWKPVPKGIEVQPEIEALQGEHRVVCVYGTDDVERSVCPLLDAKRVEVEALPGGHHFDGHYAELAAFVPD